MERKTVTARDAHSKDLRCTGNVMVWAAAAPGSGMCWQPVGQPHHDDCSLAYAVAIDRLVPCCAQFQAQGYVEVTSVIDTPASGVQVTFATWDYSMERMRFCPWCGKRFEVASE